MDAKREEPLVTAVQAGVPGAFAQLYAVYSPHLYRTIIAITKHPEDAQDVLQETFLRAHLKIRAFEGRSDIYSWLSRIAIDCALMILRKRRARPEVLFDPHLNDRCETVFFEPKDPAPNPEEVCDSRQRQAKALHVRQAPARHFVGTRSGTDSADRFGSEYQLGTSYNVF